MSLDVISPQRLNTTPPDAPAAADGAADPDAAKQPVLLAGNPSDNSSNVVEARRVRVPQPLFSHPQGGTYDPTHATANGRRWLEAQDLARYLNHAGFPYLSSADLVAANPGKAQRLGGQAVFEVGSDVLAMPGAARLQRIALTGSSGDITVKSGVSGVVGGNVGGPFSAYALVPVNPSTGQPDVANTKIFYSIPGTPIVGTIRPSDGSIATGLGGSIKVGSFVLFGNVRLEIDTTSNLTGLSVNGGALGPLPLRPGEMGGVAGSASVWSDVDWSLIMRVWSQTPGL